MSAGKALRNELLGRYLQTHALHVSAALYRDPQLAWPYFETNYRSILEIVSRDARICEVGPGSGSLLGWLRSIGFKHLDGVDASPDDVSFANAYLGSSVVTTADAGDYLKERAGTYDVVIAKAVLEHVPKAELLDVLRSIQASLTRGGLFIADVPNMDWLLASHERYMDLTHEIGFTRESLTSLLSFSFTDVQVTGSRVAGASRSQRWFRPILVSLIRRGLYVLGEGASDILFDCRSLIATARSST